MPANSFAPGGYEIIRLLGSGGTARVYLAAKKSDGRHLALKVPLEDDPDSIPQFLSLIRREYQLAGHLRYPGLIRLKELNEKNQPLPYLAMEYCPGITLDRAAPIDLTDTVLNIISSISINLYFLSLIGLSHGDLKPHNIFLTGKPGVYSGNYLRYTRISDFSLSMKSGEAGSDRLGVGTIGYMAPEAIENKALDHKSDIFSLGIIAYCLVTGRHPFMETEKDPVRVNACIKEFSPPPPVQIKGSLPDGLSDLIMSMLEKSPDKRPQDAFVICERLEQIGSEYPFRKSIRPKHLFINISDAVSNEEFLRSGIFTFDNGIIERLLDYAGNDQCRLRSILEINFTKGLLGWHDGKLVLDRTPDRIIWPTRLQRQDRIAFHQLPYSKKKKIMLTSVAGGFQQAGAIGIISDARGSDYITRPLIYYAGKNLSAPTTKRFANKLAETALTKFKDEVTAAKLYLKAENLKTGYSVTLGAVNKLLNENHHESAFNLLKPLENLCRADNDIEKLKVVLMKSGDTQKMIGEASGAEKTYKTIIALYGNQKADRLLAETYKDLGDLYKMKQNYEEGIRALREAEKIYSDLDDQLELSHTLNNIGNIFCIKSSFRDAISSYRKALRIQRKLDVAEDIASTLNNTAVIHYYIGRYERTMQLFKLALKIQRETGNASEIARSLNNLGLLHLEMSNLDESLDSLNESTAINRKIGSKKELLNNLDNLTQVMLQAGRLKDSVRYIQEGMNLSAELADRPLAASLTINLASVQKRMGRYGQALTNFSKALGLLAELNDDYRLAFCKTELAELHYRLNDCRKALDIIESVIELAGRNNDKRALLHSYLVKACITNEIGLFDKAISVAEESKAHRSRNIAVLRYTRMLMLDKKYDRALARLQELSNILVEGNSDIENADYSNLRGSYCLATGDLDSAKTYFEKGCHLARSSALLPELIDALGSLGKLSTQKKDYEEGYRYYRDALEAVRTMADDINDEALKQSFLSNEKTASMAGEVKKLRQILAQKEKAGP